MSTVSFRFRKYQPRELGQPREGIYDFLQSISLGLTSNHPSSYEGCRRKGSQEKLCIERGSLPFEIIVLSLIFDRLQDASHIINTEERMVSLLNDMLNFFFFIQLYRFLKICYFFFRCKISKITTQLVFSKAVNTFLSCWSKFDLSVLTLPLGNCCQPLTIEHKILFATTM